MKRKKKHPHSSRSSQFSRRGFLKGAGLTAAGTVMATTGVMKLKGQPQTTGGTLGPGKVNIRMKVNGKLRELSVEPRMTLADALRKELQLTGTKVGCNRGSCSACTLWLDGIPVLSCMTLALEIGEREVTTIEGIAKKGKLHPLQEAFIEHDASQCGYCTSGMIMSTAGLLKDNPDPSLEDVKSATRGNLCRCGTHPKVFAATLDAAKKM
jgi:carbon-monoxide dehydrogenase small subunit/xanthine dehydrogenase YagT iron-sulfur-binding subunit